MSLPFNLVAECRSPTTPIPDNLIIGEIDIVNRDVFDTTIEHEDTWLHRSGNAIHIKTRKEVIRRQLLFTSGDTFTPALIAETERLLRSNIYLKTAHVVPVRICDDRVDLRVITTDGWTLTPGVSFGRSGGTNTVTFEIEEHNVLGYGKALTLDKKTDNDRVQNIFSYKDDNLLGSRNTLSVETQDNSDGKGYFIETGLPFFQFSSDHAWSVEASSLSQENPIYEQGIIVDRIGSQRDSFSATYAWSTLLDSNSVQRYRIGWSYSSETSFATDMSPTIVLPDETIYASPYVGWQYLTRRFIERTDLYGVGVDIVEDIFIGENADIRIGWIDEKWGSTESFLSLKSSYSRGFQPRNKHIAFLSTEFEGLLKGSHLDAGILGLRSDWFLFHSSRSRLHVFGSFEFGHNLSIENQITIGGDSGLRGYPLKYQNGDRKFLLSVEDRYFFDWYPLRLIKTGVTAFADMGSAWDSKSESIDTLRNVGFGLLIASTRQSGKKVMRVDFAFPLDDTETVDKFQILVGVQEEF